MAWAMAVSAGMNFLGAIGQYKAAKAEAKAKRAWQAYSNTMANLSGAMSQNVITDNQVATEQASVAQSIGINQSLMTAEGAIEVAAASESVAGRSVNQTMLDVQRSAAQAERERQKQLAASRLAFDQQRSQVAMQQTMSQDNSYIPKPQLGSYLLSAAKDTYDFGQKIYDRSANPPKWAQTVFGGKF